VILKNSENIRVERVSIGGAHYIRKIDLQKRGTLLEEIETIVGLMQRWDFYKSHFPRVVSGINANDEYHGFDYFLDYIPSRTLSEVLETESDEAYIHNVVSAVYGALDDQLQLEFEFSRHCFKRSLTDAINYEVSRISEFHPLSDMLERSFVIMGVEYAPIKVSLEQLYGLAKIKDSSDLNTHIRCPRYHYNFHGGNILISKGPVSDFWVIDPDTKLRGLDPIFGLSRFVYTMVHDLANKAKFCSVHDLKVYRLTLMEDPIGRFPGYCIFQSYIDQRLWAPEEKANRLLDHYILCLLRGIRMNYRPQSQCSRIREELYAPHLFIAMNLVLVLCRALDNK